MTRIRTVGLAVIVCVQSMLAFAQDGGERRVLTIDDLLAMRSVADPQISPDGRWIAYTVESVDVDADESSTQIYMVSHDGADVVQLTASGYSASTPRWRSNGRELAFIAARGDGGDASSKDDAEDARPQVWTLDMRGGDSRQYTKVDQGVTGFAWSPNGQRMLLEIRDKTAAELAKEAAEEAGEEVKPLPYVIDRLQFKQDGQPYLDRSRTHLYVVDDRDAEPLQLTFGDFDDSQPSWSPDGKLIAFVSNRTDEPDSNVNSDIWIVSAEGDAATRESRRLTRNPGSDHSPAWSNDGRRIAYVASRFFCQDHF